MRQIDVSKFALLRLNQELRVERDKAIANNQDELRLLRTIAILAKDVYAWCKCQRPQECCAWCNLIESIKEWEGRYPNQEVA